MNKNTSIILIAAVAGIMIAGAFAVTVTNAAFAIHTSGGNTNGGAGGANGVNHGDGSYNAHGGNPNANGGNDNGPSGVLRVKPVEGW